MYIIIPFVAFWCCQYQYYTTSWYLYLSFSLGRVGWRQLSVGLQGQQLRWVFFWFCFIHERFKNFNFNWTSVDLKTSTWLLSWSNCSFLWRRSDKAMWTHSADRHVLSGGKHSPRLFQSSARRRGRVDSKSESCHGNLFCVLQPLVLISSSID